MNVKVWATISLIATCFVYVGTGTKPNPKITELLDVVEQFPEAHRDAMTRYRVAFEQYTNRQFADAAAGFEAVDALLGGDRPSQILAARSRQFFVEPPPEGWDGARQMKEK